MKKLTPGELFTLESYARERNAFRTKVLAHKRLRQVSVGPNTTWLFEDRLTIQYQVQEMLRTERIFESHGIKEELDSYNPLIPDGSNWKVTLLVEFVDPEVRAVRLTQLKGIEDRCWIQVRDFARVAAIADEDLERENDTKTSAVHFLRFELDSAMIGSLRAGAAVAMGVDHSSYQHSVDLVPDGVRRALILDFD
jgi:Protein of unknown function (DUF3501)